MNTPEQIADDYASKFLSKDSCWFEWCKEVIQQAIAEATQPLHQRLIAAEVQVGKMKEALALWSFQYNAFVQSARDQAKRLEEAGDHYGKNFHEGAAGGAIHMDINLQPIKDSLATSPSPRTYEAFTAMVKALEGYRRYELLSEAAERHTEDSRDLGYENDPTGSLHVTESSEKATKQFAHFQDLASIAIQLAKEVAG